MSELNYIIIQAGGKGTRLKEYTRNKPKAIVSINNLPLIFHLFRRFPKQKYVIIGDYKKDVLDRYLDVFSEVEFISVGTNGNAGTCSGIPNALKILPEKQPFMLIWSDLILGSDFNLPPAGGNYVGISESFNCRWSFDGTAFEEVPSCENGVAGLFIFEDKSVLSSMPSSGEFVRWLQQQNISFKRIGLGSSAEYGLVDAIERPIGGRCRPFNKIDFEDARIVKRGIDAQGQVLAVREKAWYSHVESLQVPIPKIYSFEPLVMERIQGKNVFEYRDLSQKDKEIFLQKIIVGLNAIHTHDHCQPDRFSIHKAYFTKTCDRISKIRHLVPFANDPIITINGKKCKNVFYHLDRIKMIVDSLPCDHFCLIHGDCTFSNIMLRNDMEPVFIDPRGYFGNCEIVGDPLYDWVKLYYSVHGNYDQFNLGRFQLFINESDVVLDIDSNGWECVEKTFWDNIPKEYTEDNVRFVHALVWLSLSTYAWNDYDSICGAFYNGVLLMEDCL